MISIGPRNLPVGLLLVCFSGLLSACDGSSNFSSKLERSRQLIEKQRLVGSDALNTIVRLSLDSADAEDLSSPRLAYAGYRVAEPATEGGYISIAWLQNQYAVDGFEFVNREGKVLDSYTISPRDREIFTSMAATTVVFTFYAAIDHNSPISSSAIQDGGVYLQLLKIGGGRSLPIRVHEEGNAVSRPKQCRIPFETRKSR